MILVQQFEDIVHQSERPTFHPRVGSRPFLILTVRDEGGKPNFDSQPRDSWEPPGGAAPATRRYTSINCGP